MAFRQHCWNPYTGDQSLVDEKYFLYTFCEKQEAGTWRKLHVHNECYELTYVANGSIVVCTGAGNLLGQPHRAILIPPGLEHEWYMPESSFNRSLFLHPSLLAPLPRFRHYQSIEIDSLLRALLLALNDLRVDLSHEEDRRLAVVFIDRLKKSREVGTPMLMPSEHRLVELCTAVLSSPEENVNIQQWCDRIGMSPKTLSRLFVRQTGLTFGKWIQTMRLQHAKNSLEGGENVTVAAMNCGYSSVSAFISAFKKQYGVTPGGIRK